MARELLQPWDYPCELPGGGEKVFVLSKFPAIAGREIIAKYPLSSVPKLGEYAVNEETMLKLMSYVGIRNADGSVTRLATRDLIDAHCASWEVLARVEYEMLKGNCSFFADGRASTFLQGLAQLFTQSLTKMSMGLLDQLSQVEKQRSTNSSTSTP